MIIGGSLLGGGLLAAGVAVGGGGGGSSGAAAVANAVAVTVIGGPVIPENGLSVELFAADGVTKIGEIVLNSTGQATTQVGDYTGVVIAHVVDSDDGADYLDEATGANKDLNAELYAVGVITSLNSTLSLNLNVLTTVAYHKAVAASDNGALTGEIVDATNAAVAEVFGLTDLHNTTVITTNGDDGYDAGDGLSEGETYGAVLAALAGADDTNGGDTEVTIEHLVNGITVDGTNAQIDEATQTEIIKGGDKTHVNDDNETTVIVDTHPPVFTSAELLT
jgi:hypothetical protein